MDIKNIYVDFENYGHYIKIEKKCYTFISGYHRKRT
jgi:hypothetical protein